MFWYDTKERLIGNHKINYMGGVTKTEMKLDFPGNINESKVYHTRSSTDTEIIVKQRYVYNAQNLLVKHYHQVDTGQEELLEEPIYDDLGRVSNKKVGNNLQQIDYTYNVRGWLTSINNTANLGNDIFAFKINFNQREGVEIPNNDFSQHKVKPKYNGSISETSWSGSAGNIQRYGYVYDGGGRMLAGLYQNNASPYNKEHSEIVNYDNRGNINSLYRTSYKPLKGTAILIDNLTYTNNGNRVTNINDNSGNANGYEGGNGLIGYDVNGNITAIPDKGITNITYNFLNLPTEINDGNSTFFLYSADGTKLKKTLTLYKDTGNVKVITEYLDGFQYSSPNTAELNGLLTEPPSGSGVESAKTASEPEAFISSEIAISAAPPGGSTMELVFFPTSEGFYDYKNKLYIYQYKDHLGNVRISYTKNTTTGLATVIDNNTYYPFGMNHLNNLNASQYNPLSVPYNYKYNQKELQETGFYDYGWRQYMPDLGRWNGMDILSESYHSFSPYAYVMNNPIMFFDPNGMLSQSFINEIMNSASGTTWYNNNDGSFTNNWGDTMSNDGIGMNFNSSTGFYGGRGGGGGGGMPTINIPTVYLTGSSSGWGSQIQSQFNSYMNSWNAQNWGDAAHGGLYGLGHGLNYVGDNILGTRGKTGGATPGTSIASQYFRSTEWGKTKAPKSLQGIFYNRNGVKLKTPTWGGVAGRATPYIGRGVVAISAGMSIYNVATADNKALAASQEVGGWAGAYVGAQMGAELGATIGSLFPGAGTLIGGVVGGVIGGAIGYGYGSDFRESIYYDF